MALNEREKRLIDLRYLQGYMQISEQEGDSQEMLKMRLYRARKRLRIALISLILLMLLACAAAGKG